MDGYEMTANAGSEVFLIAFVNESNHAYHDANYPASADTPTAAFIADYDAFVAAKSQMDFFGGIVYPVVGLVPTNVEANFLINTYAAMKAPLDLSETEFSGLTGTNFDNSAYDFAETTNPYLNYPLGLYGWNAVLSKHTIGGNTEVLSFTAQDFADDINNILSGANATTSQVSLFQSYVNQILTLRGVRSNSISLEILPGGCIQMEVNGISTFLESHEQRIADLEQCCDDAPQLVSFDNLNANGSIGQASNQVAFGDHDHEIGDIDVFFENALA